ncbi:hypothetical protein KFE98_05055 [bacterium SCSIO 12741]|nr:hypothetical protein KFE98_05055 [bacterium SCSIO 12741]
MVRKIVFGVLLAAFAGLLVFAWFKLTQTKKINYEYYEAIPYSSAVVVEFRDPAELFSRVQNTNLIYDELRTAGLVGPLDQTLEQLDTLLSSEPWFKQNLSQVPVLMAWIPGGAQKFSFLLSIRVPSTVDEDDFKEQISRQFETYFSGTDKAYDSGTITLLKRKGSDETYAMSFHKGYFLFSPMSIVIEESIRQINSGVSLKSKPNFLQAYQTAGTSKSINVYINHQVWSQYISSLMDPSFSNRLASLQSWASWTELDGIVKPNGLLFNGYSFAADSVQNFLSLFEGRRHGLSISLVCCPPIRRFFTTMD